MRTLTIREPYAGLILAGHKDVENRSWQTHYRGPLLIHVASQRRGVAESWFPDVEHPARGTIAGVVDVVDCVWDSYESPWATRGCWHWVLDDPLLLPDPVPCSGQLSLWTPRASVLRQVRRQLG